MAKTSMNHESETSSDDENSWRNALVLALLLTFPSTGFVQKYTGLAGVAVYVALAISVVFLTARYGSIFAPWLRRHFRTLAALAVIGLAVGFVLLHPLEDGRGPGKSSDRDEGLELAVTRMAHGRTPYYPSDKSAGPLSVLPGSIVLAAPFVALENSGYQNVFWLAAFLFGASRFFKDKALALWLLAVPLALSPAAQYEYVSGGDMLANGIYVALFFLLALRSWSKPNVPGPQKWLACLLLGIGLASRSNFFLLLPLFGAVLWRKAGLRHAIAATGIVVLTSAAITLPFYFHDPAGFTPLMAKQKLAVVDQALPWAGNAIIAMTAMAAILGAVVLLRRAEPGVDRAFFRWCALVTMCPMVCAVALFSLIHGRIDFSFMRDRFGLMYVFFAMIGWGGQIFGQPSSSPVSEEIEPVT
jgi:hypothetical protein